ncbi:helix-turn-helix transcriptional regulator [Mycobacterium sp.]|uniref:helix-turn-helix transcriptional regulator n=1 Tax=Mycobacterium sp. TaxID=1785 RepID=UPI003D0C2AAF
MPAHLQSSVQGRAASNFLDTATIEPAALVVEGEAGIGKTTLWLAAIEQARDRGFRVLSARAAAAESVLAYAALGDLLGGVTDDTLAGLPAPQRLAIDRVLLRAQTAGGATDQHAVAAAFLSIVTGLAAQSPVLLAIDDVQWLDSSSVQAVAFAARRLAGPVGVLGAARTDPGSTGAAWLQLPNPDAVRRVGVTPLSVGALHTVLGERLGRTFSRPTMVRIHDVSGGNPFYALELARAIDGRGEAAADMLLPGTLAELVRARIGSLGNEVQDLLLAVACLAEPTVDLVARATGGDTAGVVAGLEAAESAGILGFEGPRLRFAHPLLARGVYTEASPAHRRAMHRRLAGIVEHPELAARHLALSATGTDPDTVRALDVAAKSARDRGAPAAAAELVELAIALGGDTPKHRIRLAGYLFHAGDLGRARRMLEDIIDRLEPGVLRAGVLHLLAAVRLSNDSFVAACAALQRALSEVGDNLGLRLEMLVMLSWVQVHAGHPEAAAANIADAVAGAQQLGVPRLLSQALSLRAFVGFLRGEGLDAPALRQALELDDQQAGVTVAYWPKMQNAQLAGWAGQLDHARQEMASIWELCTARGRESELDYVAFYFALIEIWRGDFTAATVIAADAVDRARQLDSDLSLAAVLTVRALLAAYTGRVDDARADAVTARAASALGGAPLMAMWSVAAAGFAEVSLGRYDAALTGLAPALSALDAAPEATEIFVAPFLPDAIEALIGVGRLTDAEPLIERLQRNGARLDRPWMLATGARCRAMLLAARGDAGAAGRVAQQAMCAHERLPMPFERARTQLLVGQLQRRQRQKNAAAATLREALVTFEELGTPLWAARASTELARIHSTTTTKSGVLTASEHRVAELAATGMTNRDVAAALFITPKTVEANLARIYRKLGIRSRAELGRHMSQPGS